MLQPDEDQRLLFVCLGNICRSPTAEEALRTLAQESGTMLHVESCGIGAWHVGKPAYGPMVVAAKRTGLDLTKHRARLIEESDFNTFDFIFSMDEEVHAEVMALRPSGSYATCEHFKLSETSEPVSIPDPYYTRDFDAVVQMIADNGQEVMRRIGI